ncbi:MAG: methylmalonyl-CoA mutase family protein [Anaerolineae bacterium]|nr:methylmalonyl-CoA mutase family protein [Anaerolineae bacterium]MDW8172359.1 methylmalonyl-CoA mutase family protein [Anaerolineae bacterium]
MFDAKKLEKLARSQADWKQNRLEPTLKRLPERKKTFTTLSGVPIERLYTPLDIAELDYERDLGNPGEYPFTRGIHASGYRGKPWTMRMFAGFGTAEETNERFKFLVSQGNMGLSVAFDLPTLMGYDTDDPESEGEFGKCGVAISCLRDMERLFEGIPLGEISTSMTINSPAAIIWAFYIAAAERQGVPMHKLRGTLQNDILKEFIAQKEFVFPPEPSMKLVTDTIEFATQHMPEWNSISISGYHIREAGSTAVQELAFTLADGIEYVRWAIARGMDVDDFAPRLSFFFNLHNDFFEEIAKLRAARRIWAKVMRERFGAKNERSWLMRFHCQTAGVSLTAQQPQINLVRVAIQALAAVLGGTQSLHTNSMDEALALPSEHAVTLALRTQQIILEESGVANTVDPLGGSFFVEALTDQTEKAVWDYFEKIDALGGVLPAIENGFFQREIGEAAYRLQIEADRGERITVGVNRYADNKPLDIPILEMDPQGYDKQVARLRQLRAERDQAQAQAALEAIRQAAQADQNLMPHFIHAAKVDCTLGEMMDVLREVYGVYQEPLFI